MCELAHLSIRCFYSNSICTLITHSYSRFERMIISPICLIDRIMQAGIGFYPLCQSHFIFNIERNFTTSITTCTFLRYSINIRIFFCQISRRYILRINNYYQNGYDDSLRDDNQTLYDNQYHLSKSD